MTLRGSQLVLTDGSATGQVRPRPGLVWIERLLSGPHQPAADSPSEGASEARARRGRMLGAQWALDAESLLLWVLAVLTAVKKPTAG